jgi:hypothetical protein
MVFLFRRIQFLELICIDILSLAQKLYQKLRYGLIKRHFYYMTSSVRVLPDFIVIGAAKSGTTSLYEYFRNHSNLFGSYKKEIGFFDNNYNLGTEWYRTWFPTKSSMEKRINNNKNLAYEVSPSYFQSPWCIKNMHETIPNPKLILVLRNPVDRTYSHYQHSTRRGIKTKIPFRDLLNRDLETYERIKNEDNGIINKEFLWNSYIGPSIYAKLIKEWLKYFSLDQLLIFSTEELKKNHRDVFSRIHDFLNIKDEEIDTVTKHNTGGDYTPLDSDLRQKLINFFKPHNEELFNIINQKFDWDK